MTFKLASALEMELEKVHLLDIGAMDEGEDRFESLRTSGELRVTGFEPDPTQFERLQANPREGHTYHPFFLGNGGSGTFHVTAYPGCSSLFEPDSLQILEGTLRHLTENVQLFEFWNISQRINRSALDNR